VAEAEKEVERVAAGQVVHVVPAVHLLPLDEGALIGETPRRLPELRGRRDPDEAAGGRVFQHGLEAGVTRINLGEQRQVLLVQILRRVTLEGSGSLIHRLAAVAQGLPLDLARVVRHRSILGFAERSTLAELVAEPLRGLAHPEEAVRVDDLPEDIFARERPAWASATLGLPLRDLDEAAAALAHAGAERCLEVRLARPKRAKAAMPEGQQRQQAAARERRSHGAAAATLRGQA